MKNAIRSKKKSEIIPIAKQCLNATKKIKKSPKHIKINMEEILEKKIEVSKTNNSLKYEILECTSVIDQYLIPRIKYSEVVGVFSKQQSLQDFHILLTPDNYQEVILKSNVDIIIFDLSEIIANPSWFSLGTYESINILRVLINIIRINSKVSTVLLENTDISVLPLFLELKKMGFFDFVKTSN